MGKLLKTFPVPDDNRTTIVTYVFMEPLLTMLNHPDGTFDLMGYGIGDQIKVVEPRIQYLLASKETRTKVELENGDILTVPEDINVQRVYE